MENNEQPRLEDHFKLGEPVRMTIAISASRNVLEKVDIAYKIVFSADISWEEAFTRVIADLQRTKTNFK